MKKSKSKKIKDKIKQVKVRVFSEYVNINGTYCPQWW